MLPRLSHWLLRFELNRGTMLDKGLTLGAVQKALQVGEGLWFFGKTILVGPTAVQAAGNSSGGGVGRHRGDGGCTPGRGCVAAWAWRVFMRAVQKAHVDVWMCPLLSRTSGRTLSTCWSTMITPRRSSCACGEGRAVVLSD